MSKWQVLDPNGNPLPLTFFDQSSAMKYAYLETRSYRAEGYKKGDYKVKEIK